MSMMNNSFTDEHAYVELESYCWWTTCFIYEQCEIFSAQGITSLTTGLQRNAEVSHQWTRKGTLERKWEKERRNEIGVKRKWEFGNILIKG